MTAIPPDDFIPVASIRHAIIDMTIPEFEEKLKTSFEKDVDDLGDLEWLAIRLDSGATFILTKYEDAAPGTELWGEEDLDLDEVAHALGIPRSMIEPTLKRQE